MIGLKDEVEMLNLQLMSFHEENATNNKLLQMMEEKVRHANQSRESMALKMQQDRHEQQMKMQQQLHDERDDRMKSWMQEMMAKTKIESESVKEEVKQKPQSTPRSQITTPLPPIKRPLKQRMAVDEDEIVLKRKR